MLIATLIARPLQRIAGVAAAVDSGDLSLRAGALGGRGEVAVLATAFDHMLERLERAFARQRDFVSDASHELRTPWPSSAPRSSCWTAKTIRTAATRDT